MLRDPEPCARCCWIRAARADRDRRQEHPADDGGKQLIAQMVQFADDPGRPAPHHVPARLRTSAWRATSTGASLCGSTPTAPARGVRHVRHEGGADGALNLSILDGCGTSGSTAKRWAIPSADGVTDDDRRDDLEANAMYDLIEPTSRRASYDVHHRRPDAVGEMCDTRSDARAKVLGHPDGQRLRAALYAPAASSARAWRQQLSGGPCPRAVRAGVLEAWPGSPSARDSQLDERAFAAR